MLGLDCELKLYFHVYGNSSRTLHKRKYNIFYTVDFNHILQWSGQFKYLNDQEDIGRGVCDGENSRTGQGRNGCVRCVWFEQPFHLIGVQVKVEILRDLLKGREDKQEEIMIMEIQVRGI